MQALYIENTFFLSVSFIVLSFFLFLLYLTHFFVSVYCFMMIDSLMSPVLDWFVCFIIKEKKKKLLTMEQNQMFLIEAFFFFKLRHSCLGLSCYFPVYQHTNVRLASCPETQ